jgi:hypothetical protein
MCNDDQRLRIDWRSNFRRLTDCMGQELADFAEMRFGVGLYGCYRRVLRTAAINFVVIVVRVLWVVTTVANDVEAVMVMMVAVRQ